MTPPFLIFPWDKPFLQELQRNIVASTDGKPGRAVVIVPHNRPRRYLTELFRTDASLPRPALLPRMLTIQELLSQCRACTVNTPLHTANLLDRIALLYQCVKELAHEDADLCARFAEMDMAAFFPWGHRLAGVLEECFTQQVEAHDMAYTEGEVSPLATALLGALGRLRAAYASLLEERQWTTPGLDAFMVAKAPERIPFQLTPGQDRQMFVAGFAVLSGAEGTVLRHLWRQGAQICLHTDPAVADPETRARCHWACEDHARWIALWNATCRLTSVPSGRRPRLHFIAGYDAHSQLAAMRDALAHDEATSPSTAIVLTDAGLLLPALHHLPDKDVNVSMGYPLERSPLCRLLETILRMQATRQEDGRYHWRALLHCLRHPYLNMLQPSLPEADAAVQTSPEEPPRTLRELLLRMEGLLRAGSRFAAPKALAEEATQNAFTDMRALLEATLRCVVDGFAAPRTPMDMADAIARLCNLLLEHGGNVWERYPLDAESMYRLLQRVIPTLRDSELAQTPFPMAALHSLTRQALRAERIPFEADPIAGMQVLGMLETRLLHFERLLILDATDDILPGSPAQDPLLPDALRLLLGLPDARRRERTAAHTLYRLMAGAAEVYLFWQEGIQRSSLFDGKKIRSRFVDELIWEEEKQRRALLVSGQPPLTVTPCPVRPMPRERHNLLKTPPLQQQMKIVLEAGLSPTRLDTYLTCPLRFAFAYLCRLRPLEEVNEGDDPAAVGQLIHEVLQATYAPFLDRTIRTGDISPDHLGARFAAALEDSSLRHQLPPDSYFMLELAGSLRLRRFLEHQPGTTHIVALETSLRAHVTRRDRSYALRGTLDRIDRRKGALHVLDYKTGAIVRPDPTTWEDTDFWRRMELWTPGSTTFDGDHLLAETAERLRSVQLPCYLLLCTQAGLGPVRDAVWVHLRENGEEIFLLGEEMEEGLRDAVLSLRIPTLLGFISQHMETTKEFFPREGRHCGWCPYLTLCLQ